jgi:colanic acid biosynthesis glycosyl transferase WcaI
LADGLRRLSLQYNPRVRVLLMNLYYPPDTSATAKMAEMVVGALAARHAVTVLCGRPSYDPTERRSWQLYHTEETGGGPHMQQRHPGHPAEENSTVRVIRVGSTDYPRTQMKRRVVNYLSYVLLAVPRALLLPCDVVLAMTDPPFEGIVGAFVAMLKNKPYVYNIRDLYPDMAVGGSIVEPGILARNWEKLHRWALRRATRVIVLGEDMRKRILSKGVDAQRVAVVRDGAEIRADGDPGPELDAQVIAQIREGFSFVLLHAGNLGFYGAWDTLIEGARRLAGDGVGLVFVGDGAQKEKLQATAAGLENVRFLPFFPSNKIPSVLAAGDAQVITVKRGLEGVVVPSKLYGILAAGKPVVAVAPEKCDTVSLGKEKGFGVSANPEDAEAFAKCVKELMRDAVRLRSMGAAARNTAPEFERGKELEKLVALIEAATQHA